MGRCSTPFRFLAALAALASVGGCTVEEPVLNNPGDTSARTTSIYADVIISVGNGQTVATCVDGIPACKDGGPVQQEGDCANNAALGKNDGKPFVLGPGSTIEIGILCDAIVEIGGTKGASDDFKLWATAAGGAQPVVEVSVDGTTYVTTSPWPDPSKKILIDNPGFQLEAAELAVVRFVRISNPSTKGTIALDALEAFPVKRQ